MVTYRGNVQRWIAAAFAAAALLAGGCRGPSGRLSGMDVDPAEAERYAVAEGRLASEDPGVRERAAIELLGASHPLALDTVLERMRNDPDPAVRADLIRAGAFCVDHRCFEAILGAVKDPDDVVRKAAASALSRFSRPDEIEAMRRMAADRDTTPLEREILFQAMAEGLFVPAIPALLDSLTSDHLAEREAAWLALKRMSGRQFPLQPEPWLDWWEANRHRTREEMLEQRVGVLDERLATSDQRNRELQEQLDELSALVSSETAGAPQRLLSALGSRHARIRDYAAFRLASLSPAQLNTIGLDDRQTYDSLRKALVSGQPVVRERVVELATKLKGKFRTPLLLEALRDKEPNVLLKAIEAVNAEMGEPAVAQLEVALASPHAAVREAAANALGKAGSQRAVGALLQALSDEEENVRWFAVESLRKLAAAETALQIAGLLAEDPAPRVREIAASALGDLGQPAAVPALRQALQDRNERVRARVVAALKALAQDNLERMMIIADALSEGGQNAAAIEVLRDGIARSADDEALAEPLAAARNKLAEALKAAKDYQGAAALYVEMDRLSGGDPRARAALLDCYMAGGAPERILPTVEQWLQGATVEGIAAIVELGTQAARRLEDSDRPELARDVLDILLKAAEAAGDEGLVEKLRKLTGRPAPPDNGEEPPPPPGG